MDLPWYIFSLWNSLSWDPVQRRKKKPNLELKRKCGQRWVFKNQETKHFQFQLPARTSEIKYSKKFA